jgi:DnaJ family protein C protein 2
MTTEPPKKVNLFDYTEEQLLEGLELTHYDVLSVPEFATQDQIKKAYRRASLKYHPDKTGRDSEDYVFLAVKAAHDTLFDTQKRQAYDSTTMPFDDRVPPARATLFEDEPLLYKDQDFYDTFGPAFQRNLRFDARLRPDAVSKKKKNSNRKGGGTNGKPDTPPVLGEADTPMAQVHSFYEYWIHFESWRDFSSQAADELEVEQELENAESRFEKRWIQKEIDRRCKQLKRQEMTRIQLLVTRAMEADPRMRKERQEAVEAKEKAKLDRQLAAQQEKEQAALRVVEEANQAEEDKIRKAEEKIEREKDKKQLRKARQLLRRVSLESFEGSESALWGDSYDMKQDVEVLCTSWTANQIREFAMKVEETECNTKAILMIHERIERVKSQEDEPELEAQTPTSNGTSNGASNGTTNGSAESKASSKIPWAADELVALAKAVKKYPPGGASRWEQIALFVNNLCKQDHPRSKEECIEKYNYIARNAKPTDVRPATVSTVGGPTASTSATNGGGGPEDDGWSVEEDQFLQDALSKYPATMDKNERWTAISKAVSGRSKKDCVERFKTIREALKNRK